VQGDSWGEAKATLPIIIACRDSLHTSWNDQLSMCSAVLVLRSDKVLSLCAAREVSPDADRSNNTAFQVVMAAE
jgi:hypothetical protein